MTCITCPPTSAPAVRRRPLTLAARAASLVRTGWRAYWDWRARKATILILHSLDRRTLHDIGISPSEIESLVRCGDDRRRRYDATWPWRGT
jgi:uncharacterized protein YjiS (DUF1127 family)